jgi:hypothetical protein
MEKGLCLPLRYLSSVHGKHSVPALNLNAVHAQTGLLLLFSVHHHSYIPFLSAIRSIRIRIYASTHHHRLQHAALQLQLANLAHHFHQVLLSTVVAIAPANQRAIDGSPTPFAVAAPRITSRESPATKKRSCQLNMHQKRHADPKSRL